MIKTTIIDGKGSSSEVCVTARNQLVVAPLDFSTSYQTEAITIDTAFNVVIPLSGKQFIITEMIVYADKNVGVNDATIEIYEGDTDTSTVVNKCILKQELVKKTTLSLTGLNLIVTEGEYLNIKTNDNNIFLNVFGYYVDAINGDS